MKKKEKKTRPTNWLQSGDENLIKVTWKLAKKKICLSVTHA